LDTGLNNNESASSHCCPEFVTQDTQPRLNKKKYYFPKKRHYIYSVVYPKRKISVITRCIKDAAYLRKKTQKNPILRNQLFSIADPYKN
jgi:hypothetical protein